MSISINPQNYTFPSVTIQQLVFTAKRWGQFPTITYVNGGTAGSEVVTMDSSFNITIKIQNGTSTNTQIAAALNATAGTQANGMAPGDICSAAPVNGHDTDTPTCYSVALAGGVAAAKASLTIGSLKFTAHTAGTAGNSLAILFTSGATAGSEVVTDPNANGAPLQIQIADAANGSYAPGGSTAIGGTSVSGSTAAQIKAAIDTWQSGHTTYVDVAIVGPSTATFSVASTTPTTGSSLSGGLAAAAATTGAVNSLTCAANATGVTANGVTVTLIPGGTAGSEVVTDLANGSFTVQIQSGTSTVTQVRTALNADTGFAALYTSTGTSATAMQAVYQNTMSGAAGPDILGFYMDNSTTALTSSFVYMPFGSPAEMMHVENDDASGSNTIIGSWDGVNNHFIIAATKVQDFQNLGNKPGIFLKYGTGAPAYKIWTVNR